MNEQWPGLIPTTVDVNSSAKILLSQQNLWDFVPPHLHKEQDVDKSSLIASHVIGQLTTILSFLCDCITALYPPNDKINTLLFHELSSNDKKK